jgi:hypothetical protein
MSPGTCTSKSGFALSMVARSLFRLESTAGDGRTRGRPCRSHIQSWLGLGNGTSDENPRVSHGIGKAEQ